jgi:hypothetical protein
VERDCQGYCTTRKKGTSRKLADGKLVLTKLKEKAADENNAQGSMRAESRKQQNRNNSQGWQKVAS